MIIELEEELSARILNFAISLHEVNSHQSIRADTNIEDMMREKDLEKELLELKRGKEHRQVQRLPA